MGRGKLGRTYTGDVKTNHLERPKMKILPAEFDGQTIRRIYDETTEIWWFSIIDVVQVLTQQSDDLTAQK